MDCMTYSASDSHFLSLFVNTLPDPTLKDYFRNNERFADLINVIKFNGKQVLTADMMSSFDTDVSSVITDKNLYISMNRNRDVIKIVTLDDGRQLLLALENQQKVDDTMPLRILLYDGLTHLIQTKLKKDAKIKIKELNTFVLFYGQYRWNAPMTIQDMMGLSKTTYENLSVWNGRIIDIKDLDVSLFHHSDNISMIKSVQRYYASKGDYTQLADIVTTKEVAVVVATIVGNKKFAEMIMKEEKGGNNMCEYFDKMIMDAKNEGERKGEARGEARGERRGIISTLVQLLKNKFGTLSNDIIIEIENSDLQHLDELTIRISDIQKEEDISKILSH